MTDPGVVASMDHAAGRTGTLVPREFEQLVSELAADFVTMPADAIDASIEQWLERLVHALGLERATVAQHGDDGSLLVRTHSYTAPGYLPLPAHIRTGNDLPWLAQQMQQGRTVVLSTVKDLPAEAVRERQFMLGAGGARSSIVVPLVVGGNAIGLVSFTSMSREREWPKDVVKRLQLVASILTSALTRKHTEQQVVQLLQFEQLLSTISATFIQLPISEVDRELTHALKRIVEFLDVDRGSLLSLSADGTLLHRTHWHVNPGVDSVPQISGADFPWTFATLGGGEPVVVSRTRDLPDAAASERDYFKRTGVRSTIAVPLMQGDRLLGAAIFSATRREVIWQKNLIHRVQLLGEVFANALARKMMNEVETHRLRFERLVSGISARLARASSDHVDGEMRRALHEILAFFDAQQCAIAEAIPETGEAHVRYQACGAGCEPLAGDGEFASLDPWEYARIFIRGEVLILKRPQESPIGSSIDPNTSAGMELRFLVCIPIATGGTVPYMFGLSCRGAERSWPDEDVARLRLLGETLVGALVRTRAEETLRTNEERFRRVVEAALNGVMMVDRDGRIVMVNGQLESTFGYGREELLGKQVEMLLPPRYRDRHRAYRSQFLADPRVRPVTAGLDLYGLRKDGMEVAIEVGLNPIRMGEEVFVLATVVDISARKQAEQQLRESAQRLAEAQRIARLGSWEWDIATDTMTGSEEARRILGIAHEEFNRFIDYVHPDERQEFEQTVEQLFRDRKEAFDLEYRIIRPDGAERIVRDQGDIYYASDGVPLRAVGTIRDVTDLRLAEQEARKLRTQLWHADRVVRTGALTASLSHELNQPLAAILSNAQAALRFLDRDNPDLGEVKDILRDIVRDDKRAAAVVSGLRAMVRRQQTERETIDMATVVGEMLAFLHSEFVGANIDVRTDFEADCIVVADRVQLQQVVLNLVINAIEAMREPAVEERRLQLTVRRTAGGTVRVAIRDSGPGIPPERLGSVFDAFWTTKSEGMGLGLAVCASIIDSHGGRIWVESNDGAAGITFLFELPSNARTDVELAASSPRTGYGETR